MTVAIIMPQKIAREDFLISISRRDAIRDPVHAQRLHGEDVITTPKTKKSNRMIKMPKFLCEEMQDYLQMLYGLKKKDRIFTVTKNIVEVYI